MCSDAMPHLTGAGGSPELPRSCPKVPQICPEFPHRACELAGAGAAGSGRVFGTAYGAPLRPSRGGGGRTARGAHRQVGEEPDCAAVCRPCGGARSARLRRVMRPLRPPRTLGPQSPH
eukprot:7572666-Pyramimonas_sp.AAC.2